MILLKRVYDPPTPNDGPRILVERLWPRGLTKARASIDLWLKDIAPSPELRQWFSHDPTKWKQFRQRYWNELKANPTAVAELRRKTKTGSVTFVYAARDADHNSTLVLKEFLDRPRRRGPSRSD